MSSSIAAEKQRLREAARAVRDGLGATARQQYSAAIVRRLHDVIDIAASAAAAAGSLDSRMLQIAVYLAKGSEVSLDTFIAAPPPGCLVAAPLSAAESDPRFAAIASLAQCVPGPWGMRWPPASAPQVAAESLDVVVVPGIAFDRSGGRLGQGGGWYDRALTALCPRAVVIGVCFDCQLAATLLPSEAHDRRAGVVLTETQTLYASHSVS